MPVVAQHLFGFIHGSIANIVVAGGRKDVVQFLFKLFAQLLFLYLRFLRLLLRKIEQKGNFHLSEVLQAEQQQQDDHQQVQADGGVQAYPVFTAAFPDAMFFFIEHFISAYF